MRGIENCKSECNAHPSCLGFVVSQVSSGLQKCGFWKGGTLAPRTENNHSCYSKIFDPGNLKSSFQIWMYVQAGNAFKT